MRKRIARSIMVVALLATLFCVAGCSQLVEREANFVAYNVSPDNVEVVVNGGAGIFIPANGSIRFQEKILVPRQSGTSLSPTNNPRVQISIAFRNLFTGDLTTPQTCYAGPGTVTHVWYEVSSRGRESVRCRASSSY